MMNCCSTDACKVWETLQVSAFMEHNELLQVIQPDIWSLREIRSLCSWGKMNCFKWFNQRDLTSFCALGARWIVASDSTAHMRFERTSMLLCSWSKMNCCKWLNHTYEVWENFHASVFLEQDELLQVIQPGIQGLRDLLIFCVLGARFHSACFLC